MIKGDKIEVLCHNFKTKIDEWLPGEFEEYTNAWFDGRQRINCTLDNGKEIQGAAPECVRELLNKKQNEVQY